MKNRQRSHFKFIAEYLSNLEKNHDFYIRRLKEGIGNKDMLQIEIEILRACYEVTKNPIILWRSIKGCIEAEIDFPDWVTDYLLKSSGRIIDSAYSYNPEKRDKDILADAFEFKEIGGPWNNRTQYVEKLKWFIKVSEVMQMKMNSDLSFEKIEVQVANKYFPDDEDKASTEARKFRMLREKLQKIPTDLDLG